MARLSKRRKKNAPQPEASTAPKKRTKRDFFLALFLGLNIFILIAGYPTMDKANVAMYSFLVLSLGAIYLKRRLTNISEKTRDLLEKGGIGCIAIACLLFFYMLYQKSFG